MQVTLESCQGISHVPLGTAATALREECLLFHLDLLNSYNFLFLVFFYLEPYRERDSGKCPREEWDQDGADLTT